MLLRLPTREDHLLNGGETRDFRANRRAGAAVWRGREAQLALARGLNVHAGHVVNPAVARAHGLEFEESPLGLA
jgi:hypothetical protein